MNIDDLAIKSANTQGGGLVPSSTGLTPDALYVLLTEEKRKHTTIL